MVVPSAAAAPPVELSDVQVTKRMAVVIDATSGPSSSAAADDDADVAGMLTDPRMLGWSKLTHKLTSVIAAEVCRFLGLDELG